MDILSFSGFIADEDAFDLETLFNRPEDLGDIGVFEDAYEDEDIEELSEIDDESGSFTETGTPERKEERELDELPEASEEEVRVQSAARDIYHPRKVIPLEEEPFEILDELPSSSAEEIPSPVMELENRQIEAIDYRRIESDFSYSPGGTSVSSLHDDNSTAGVMAGTIDRAEIDKLADEIKKTGPVEVYSFSELIPLENAVEETIEENNGVFRIKESVYTARRGDSPRSKKDFKELVDSVLKSDSERESIESIFDFGPVDLGLSPADREQFSSGEDEMFGQTESQLLTEKGFNYDVYLKDFKAGQIGIMKSLMRVSAQCNAVYSSILGFDEKGLSSQYSLGMDEESSRRLKFDKNDDLFPIFLDFRLVFLLKGRTGMPFFDSRFDERGRHFIDGHIFIPVIHNGMPAYLYLSLKQRRDSVQFYIDTLQQLMQ